MDLVNRATSLMLHMLLELDFNWKRKIPHGNTEMSRAKLLMVSQTRLLPNIQCNELIFQMIVIEIGVCAC